MIIIVFFLISCLRFVAVFLQFAAQHFGMKIVKQIIYIHLWKTGVKFEICASSLPFCFILSLNGCFQTYFVMIFRFQHNYVRQLFLESCSDCRDCLDRTPGPWWMKPLTPTQVFHPRTGDPLQYKQRVCNKQEQRTEYKDNAMRDWCWQTMRNWCWQTNKNNNWC